MTPDAATLAPSAVAATIAAWQGNGVSAEATVFARAAVAAAGPAGPARARALLWSCSRLAAWGAGVGLELVAEVLLHPSVIERYVSVGMSGASASPRRSARTNLRFVARRAAPQLAHPPPAPPLARSRAKAPYGPAEVAAYFALAGAQPTPARRARLQGLLCLGLGAGLERAELRHITGRHVIARSGGVVVVEGPRGRAVPVLARYQPRLVASAAFAGDGFICGGRSPTRKNLTASLVGRIAGGADLEPLDVGRLRATWLSEHLQRLGLVALLDAAGVVCSQRLGDLARHLPRLAEPAVVEVLGARR
jgi:integrase